MQKLFLLGRSIAHSASPAMYNALYEKLGLNWHYDLADCATESEAHALLADSSWLSVNVTTPYKPLAAAYADVKAASVKLTGGANMLFRTGEKLCALNTDGLGCVRYIQHEGFSFQDAKVVVCGTGPTSLAIFVAAAQAGAARVALISRNRDHAKEVLEDFLANYKQLAYATLDLEPAREDERSFRAAYEEASFAFGSYETSTHEIAGADIVIDATPLGMNEGDPLPFDAALLGSQTLVFDVVYGHGQSQLLAAAQQAGCAVRDGRGMVVAQAVENAAVLLDVQQVENTFTWDDMFALMFEAAGFAC